LKLSVVYLTRRCPRKCSYCTLRDGRNVGKELETYQWIRAFNILKELGVKFNLVLGNETWLLGKNLPTIMKHSPYYGLYTSCNRSLFSAAYKEMFGRGIYSFSCGADYPPSMSKYGTEIESKAADVATLMQIVRREYPKVDCQVTFTLHRNSYKNFPQYVREYSNLGVNIGAGVLQWDIDGKFDFASRKEDMEDLLLRPQDETEVVDVLEEAVSIPNNTLALPGLLGLDYKILSTLDWHCKGDPIGGPTVDADGSLRVCGYRKGDLTSKFNIFDLPKREDDWKAAVYEDAINCPGCLWSCSWMYHHWKDKEGGIEHIKRSKD
jgi:MoaA/NifB/PqqE/SkfB family radical SAM enzyme